MKTIMTYRGRQITEHDVSFIRELIAAHPEASRRALSRKLCEAWGWVQANGNLCDMTCRSLMLALHRADHISLPPVRRKFVNPLVHKRQPKQIEVDQTPLCESLRSLGPLVFRQIRRTGEEPLFNSLIEYHHYLGYTQPVGAHLKFLVYAGERPLACFAWGSAPRHLGARDRYIGWSIASRRANIRFVVYNSRFLILPWVQVPNLASHLLGRMVRMISSEWVRHYNHPVYFAETFTDPTRFKGTCYRAANWVFLGKTTGRGKNDNTRRPNRSIKDVLGYPLTARFRELLKGAS